MELTASKTANCTIAPERAWTLALPADTVVCMMAFQSVTWSALIVDAAINPANARVVGMRCLIFIIDLSLLVRVCCFSPPKAQSRAQRGQRKWGIPERSFAESTLPQRT